MLSNKQILVDLGFENAGEWILNGGLLKCSISRHGAESNILYAFVAEEQVLYIGKSVRTLSGRMYGYQRPGPSQSTNIINHGKIKDWLGQGHRVEILAFVAKEPVLYRGVPVNLAAGLEDTLIARLRPVWNRIGFRDTPEQAG